jgi:hypothetical protein
MRRDIFKIKIKMSPLWLELNQNWKPRFVALSGRNRMH